jgi:chemotaxis protein CheD
VSDPGFSWLSDVRTTRTPVLQGRLAVSGRAEVVMTAVLGSCVAACLWDEGAGVGGMNHFLLPEAEGDRLPGLRFGDFAMEELIRALVDAGGRRGALQAKLFGGAHIVGGYSDVGRRNADFATDFLARRGIPLRGGSLGGDAARRVEFWPVFGMARQRIVRPFDETADTPGWEALAI